MFDVAIVYIKSKLLYDVANLLLFGGGIIAVLKASLWFYSQRLYSFYWVYRHRNRFLTHPIFEMIEEMKNKDDVNLPVLDHTKKIILSELFYIEITKIQQILKMSLRHIFKSDFTAYLKSFRQFKADVVTFYFLHQYMDSLSARKRRARIQFTRSGMSQEHFDRLWSLYVEIINDYEIIISERLNNYAEHTDVYRVINNILDDFAILIRIIHKGIGNKFNRLNGRSYGISYQGKAIGDEYNAR